MKMIARAASTWYWSWVVYILMAIPFIYVFAFAGSLWNAASAGWKEFKWSIAGRYKDFIDYVQYVISRKGWLSLRKTLREETP